MIRNGLILLFNYLLVFNIFAGAFTLFRQPFEFYLGYAFILLFLIGYIIRYRSIHINSNFLIIMVVLSISSFVNLYFGNVTAFFIAKQVSGILITGVAYYLLIRLNDYDVEKLFKIYLRIALIVAAAGVFQELSYLIKFKIGYDFRWIPLISKWGVCVAENRGLLRVNSIFMEPSHFAVSMAPAFFVSLTNFFKKNPLSLISKWGSVVIVISYLLTFSILALIAILVCLALFCVRKKTLRLTTLIAILGPALLVGSYILIPDIRIRVHDAMAFIKHPSVNPATHMSVYTFVSNAFIAFNSFVSNFLFGSGLGSHPISYDKFFNLGVAGGFMQHNYVLVCREDAGSLALRLLSETGLFGISTVFYFIFRYHLKADNNNNLHVISNAIFLLFILQLLRQGHYFYNGLFFFVWIYYFVYKISNSKPMGLNSI